MVDLIFSYIAKAILIITSCFVYIFLVSKFFPEIFLKSKIKKAVPKDRGIKKYVFNQGRAIVYTPDTKTQKYIPQYILSENNGEKFLKCQFDNRVVTAGYEITVFNSSDQVVDIINVYDTPDRGKNSRAVPLPLCTSYLNVSVIEINHKKILTQKNNSVSFMSCALYIVLNFLATATLSIMINLAAFHIAKLCLNITESGKDIMFSIILALIISLIYTAVNIKKIALSAKR